MNALSCGLTCDFHMMQEKQPWGSRVVPRNEDYVIMKKKKRNLPDSWCWRQCDHHMLNMEGVSEQHPLHSKAAKNGNSGKEE